MRFDDRVHAGAALAARLSVGPDAVVLGIPRGGVIVAAEVARSLGAPLDVVVPRKIGAPGNPELGIGAVGPDGTTTLDDRLVVMLAVSSDYIEAEAARQLAEIRRRTAAYRGSRPPLEIAGRTCVIVDDGMATGGTAVAAALSLRNAGAPVIVVAVPVASRESVARLRAATDEVVALEVPEMFAAVGQWYEEFPQVADEEVVLALESAAS